MFTQSSINGHSSSSSSNANTNVRCNNHPRNHIIKRENPSSSSSSSINTSSRYNGNHHFPLSIAPAQQTTLALPPPSTTTTASSNNPVIITTTAPPQPPPPTQLTNTSNNTLTSSSSSVPNSTSSPRVPSPSTSTSPIHHPGNNTIGIAIGNTNTTNTTTTTTTTIPPTYTTSVTVARSLSPSSLLKLNPLEPPVSLKGPSNNTRMFDHPFGLDGPSAIAPTPNATPSAVSIGASIVAGTTVDNLGMSGQLPPKSTISQQPSRIQRKQQVSSQQQQLPSITTPTVSSVNANPPPPAPAPPSLQRVSPPPQRVMGVVQPSFIPEQQQLQQQRVAPFVKGSQVSASYGGGHSLFPTSQSLYSPSPVHRGSFSQLPGSQLQQNPPPPRFLSQQHIPQKFRGHYDICPSPTPEEEDEDELMSESQEQRQQLQPSPTQRLLASQRNLKSTQKRKKQKRLSQQPVTTAATSSTAQQQQQQHPYRFPPVPYTYEEYGAEDMDDEEEEEDESYEEDRDYIRNYRELSTGRGTSSSSRHLPLKLQQKSTKPSTGASRKSASTPTIMTSPGVVRRASVVRSPSSTSSYSSSEGEGSGDGGKKKSGTRSGEQKQKFNQGAWTTHEHDQFLKGLSACGHQWKKIAVQFVQTRSRRQVASHAQKYLEREKRRSAMSKKDVRNTNRPTLII